ncbi:hypothetical protein LzC2_42500 [Planctomycetes bacterium LzC2]|uniref:Uncharacterized protein n=1 Tax=Alienimonas chondri TaxID=2681879 RepID=A0ABX1VJ34_9PLAN|nr:hypothetical protein [Alienimonas chondri]
MFSTGTKVIVPAGNGAPSTVTAPLTATCSGRSDPPQPAASAAAKATAVTTAEGTIPSAGRQSVLIDHLAAVARGERVQQVGVDKVADQVHGAVAAGEVHAGGVIAAEGAAHV